MSRGDFWVADTGNGSAPVSHRYKVKSGAAASIKAGEWVVQNTAGDVEYVTLAVDGASNSSVWVGVAASDSTDTATADGNVEVFDSLDYVFRGRPTTPGNLATSLLLTQVTLDVVSSAMTVDENDTVNGTLLIVGLDPQSSTSAGATIDVKMATLDHISEG